MHKARVRANNYYFAKLFHKKGIKRQNYYWKNNLVFLLNDNYVSDCSYQNNSLQNIGMNEKRIREGLKFAEENFMKPIFLHSRNIEKDSLVEYEEYEVLHRIPIEGYREGLPFDEYQLIITVDSISHIKRIKEQEIVIFNIEEKNISKLSYFIEKILSKTQRININIMNISRNFNMKDYYRELKKCADLLIEEFKRTQNFKQINIITDIFFIYKHEECNAGSRSFTYAPDGNLYVCPAFYSEKMGNIGNIYTGITLPNRNLYTTKYMPICNVCDCFQCENYPCEKYDSIDEFDSFITHQHQKQNMGKFRKSRIKLYSAEQQRKKVLLNHLSNTCSDGHKSTPGNAHFFSISGSLPAIRTRKVLLNL